MQQVHTLEATRPLELHLKPSPAALRKATYEYGDIFMLLQFVAGQQMGYTSLLCDVDWPPNLGGVFQRACSHANSELHCLVTHYASCFIPPRPPHDDLVHLYLLLPLAFPC